MPKISRPTQYRLVKSTMTSTTYRIAKRHARHCYYDTHKDAAAHCSGEHLHFDDRYCLDIPFAAALNDKPSHVVPRRPAKPYGYS